MLAQVLVNTGQIESFRNITYGKHDLRGLTQASASQPSLAMPEYVWSFIIENNDNK